MSTGQSAHESDDRSADQSAERALPLGGLRVIDCATLLAGPIIAMLLGDFGAEVVKVEHPRGDPLRGHGHQKGGVGLLWKMVSRNKKAVTLSLSTPAGAEIFKRLVAAADVVVENFRPGTMERWGLGWEVLHALNPRLIMVRVTGFGQEGPYAQRAGFGTLAEAMSGFAHITGEPDGPPQLPPFGLADGICALTGFGATLTALYHRDLRGGEGQMIDLAIYEPILSILGAQVTVYDQLGVIQQRTGNRSPNVAPRNMYRTKDGRWMAVSTSADTVAERVMRLVGHPEVVDQPWFKTAKGRAEHVDELDLKVAAWIAARPMDEVLRAFEEAQAAIAPVYDASHVVADPHFQHRQTIISVDDAELGPLKMQNVIARLSATPGRIRWAGPPLGAHTAEVLGVLGYTPADLARLRDDGVI
ncbi:MAG: CoA transferase [Chloroflexi bacterium]|nr:CoA transferase [Chloroflexota bacterium]